MQSFCFLLFKFTTMFCLRISSSTITPDINTSRLFYHRMLSQFKWLLQSRIILRFVRFCCCCRHRRRRCRRRSCPCSNLVPVSNSRQKRLNSYFVQLMLSFARSLAVSVLVILRFGRECFLFWPGFSALICGQIHEMQTLFFLARYAEFFLEKNFYLNATVAPLFHHNRCISFTFIRSFFVRFQSFIFFYSYCVYRKLTSSTSL